MTATDEDFEGRLRRVLAVGAEALPVGRTVPPFGTFRAVAERRRRRRISRKLAVLGVAVSLGFGGTAAAAVIAHLGAAPVTETNLARCYSVDSLAGGRNFAGTSVAAAGLVGSQAQVANALASCTTVWASGLLTLGSTQAGGTRPPAGRLTTNHSVPSLIVCVLPGGIAGVFPGKDATCKALGLPDAQDYQKGR